MRKTVPKATAKKPATTKRKPATAGKQQPAKRQTDRADSSPAPKTCGAVPQTATNNAGRAQQAGGGNFADALANRSRRAGKALRRGDGECPPPIQPEAVIDPSWYTGEGAVARAWKTMNDALSGVKVGTAQTQAAKEILKNAGEFDKLKSGKMDGMVFEIVLADLHTEDDDDTPGSDTTPAKGSSPDTS